MTFRGKILLALGAVGIVPLALLGWQSFAVNRGELLRVVGDAQAAAARAAALDCEKWIASTVGSLRRAAAALPYGKLDARELGQVLRLPYRQLDFVDILAILDEHGDAVAPPVVEPRGASGRAAAGESEIDELSRRIPLSYALAAGTAFGPPYLARGSARLPVGLRIAEAPVRVVAAQISLAELSRRLSEVRGDGAIAYLATRDGSLVAAGGTSLDLGEEERAFAARAAAGAAQVGSLQRGGAAWLAAAAPVGDLGWAVVVARPASVAFHAADVVRRYTIFWSAVALALTALLGFLLSRGLAEPISRLGDAARALTEGRYDQTVEVSANDELGQFAAAFNHMASEVRRRDGEIRAWNEELQRRVDARTLELKLAQDQILRARRLSALGSLGAGIAHELNNPLTAINGIATLLQRELEGETRPAELLRMLVEQTRRVSKVAGDLRQFAEQERALGGRRFALAQPVQAALETHAQRCRERNIQVQTQIDPSLPEVQGDPVQLARAVSQLVENAIHAMPQGGELRVAVGGIEGDALKLTVRDTGKGVPHSLRERIFDPFFTTKESGGGIGLGLSIVHSIVEAHHGKLAVDSVEGQGATFTMVLPAAAAAAHLS